MADYSGGEYGHPYPRVDQYGNPVPPVDQYGNPVPRELPEEPTSYSSGGGIGTAPPYGVDAAGYAMAPADHGTASALSGGRLAGAAYPHEGVLIGVVSPDGAAAYPQEVPVSIAAPDATTATYAYVGVVGSGTGAAAADQIEPTREEHTTLGETLRLSGSSSSSSSSEDDGQGGRRKKSIKEKIKEKLPGGRHKQQHEAAAGTGTHAARPHEKKGIMEKIKEKLPGHH